MRRILVADDDADILDVLRFVLAQEGYEVLTTMDGLEAERIALQEAPNLIIIDAVMPGKSGWRVCESLKSSPGMGHIPIIILSGWSQTKDIERGKEVGADDVVVKPFDIEDLVRRVKALEERSTGGSREQG
ncbi:MAG TPA: response regulator [Firmicutes bacterium]|nr:response regulator [Bacillota bacterium]